jgi:hypothetical protein
MDLTHAFLARTFADPETGLLSRDKMTQKLKRAGYRIDGAARKLIKAFFDNDELTQMARPPVNKASGFRLNGPVGTLQVDVLFFPGSVRRGTVAHALAAVDVHSRRAHVEPIRGTAMTDILPVWDRMLEGFRDILYVRADNQFSAKAFVDACARYGIQV